VRELIAIPSCYTGDRYNVSRGCLRAFHIWGRYNAKSDLPRVFDSAGRHNGNSARLVIDGRLGKHRTNCDFHQTSCRSCRTRTFRMSVELQQVNVLSLSVLSFASLEPPLASESWASVTHLPYQIEIFPSRLAKTNPSRNGNKIIFFI
jgi:hypothetical protein